MDNLPKLFEAFGGPAAVGSALGKSTEHAAAMKRRGSIPVRYWPCLLHAAKTAGIPLSEVDLVAIHAPVRNVAGVETARKVQPSIVKEAPTQPVLHREAAE
jgi:hypothetical protein